MRRYSINIMCLACFIALFASETYFTQERKNPEAKREKLESLYNFFKSSDQPPSDKVIHSALEAEQLAGEIGNKFIQVKALLFLGQQAFRERNNEKTRKYFSDAITICREMKNEYLEADAELNYGTFLGYALSKPDSALLLSQKAYSAGLSLNDTTLLKSSSYYLVVFNRLSGRPVKAILSANTALKYNAGDKAAMGGVYSELFLIYSDIGNIKEAAKYFNLAFEICEETKSRLQIASLANKMGSIEELDWESSIKYRKIALDIYIKSKENFGIGYTYNLLGMSYSNAGKSEEAVRCFRKAIELLAKANNRQHLAFANANLAYEYLKLNKTGDALPYLKKAINYAVEINDKLALSDAYKTAGIYYRKTNDMASSLNYLKKAEMYARDIQNMTFLKDIYNELSICYESGGDPKNALYYLQQKNAVTDTIQKQNSRKAYIEMMVKYETVRTKEEADEAKKNISALREESEKKSFLFWGVLISVFIAAAVPLLAYKKKLAAFFHFYNNMSRRRFKDKRSEKSAVSVIGGVNPGNTPADPPAINMLAQSLKKLMDGEKKYLESELTLNETARILNTNTAYLSRVINEQNGMNFNNYINSYRIEEAKRLMDEGKQDSMTFEGIGKSCGFISRSAFNQAFKKFTGLTPTEYISKKNKENK